ncbi:MAG TPA: hypothetical protein VF056_00745 [Thermoleophilaceae bacterium]
MAAPTAMAGQFASMSFGLAGTPGSGNLPGHANAFPRDGLASQCNDGMPIGGSAIMTPGPFAYKSRAFTSVLNEPVCVTMAVSAPTCMGTDGDVMSETYSPAYNPASITANWIGDLGNSPPGSYSVVVPAGASFETVVDEVNTAASCGGVNVTWSSDRPWAGARPFPSGLAAVGQTLTSNFDVWSGDPAVGRQWKRCDAAGGSCVDIPGATGQNYVPSDDDVGHMLRVDESATEGGLTSTVEGRTTSTPVFIPAVVHEGQSLVAGDPAVSGHLAVMAPPSSCTAPKSAPPTSGNEIRFYDVFAVRSLINEPACVWVAQIPRAGGSFCSAGLVFYSPTFDPAGLTTDYVADDSNFGTLSATLAPGASAQAVIFDDGTFHMCSDYGLMIGSDAPFATGRPQLAGGSTAGTPVTTTTGDWNGAPAFAYSWQRCDASGGGCVPIGGATGPAYTPTGGDVGSTLRARVTATRAGRSASSDSEPTGVIAAAPLDRTAPRGTVRLGSRNLAKIVKSGRVPVTVTCDEACAAVVQVRVTRKLAKALGLRRKTVIAKAKGSAAAGGKKTLRGRLAARARRAMRRRNSLKLRLAATFTDAAGNRAEQARKGTLKRPSRRR